MPTSSAQLHPPEHSLLSCPSAEAFNPEGLTADQDPSDLGGRGSGVKGQGSRVKTFQAAPGSPPLPSHKTC